MSKNVWGPPTWQLLHCMALKVKETITGPQLQELKKLIERLISNLPCPICSSHAIQFFKQNRFTLVATVQQLQQFLFLFHNNVNARLSKPLITYDEHILLYQPMRMNIVVQHMFHVYQNMNSTNVTMMLYSFHRRTILQDLHSYFKANHPLFEE